MQPKFDPFLDLEEKQLRAEASKLHAEVAKISAELAQALKFSAETETSATEAAEAAVKAAQEANRIQQELEAKRRAEEKEAKALQREKELELEKLRAEKRRAEEEKKRLEKERKLRQKMTGRTPVWEAWPPQVIHVPQGDFDNGIGCLIRARGGGALNPTVDIQCQVLRQTDTNFVYNTNEELVSNIIRLKRKNSDEENEKLKQTIYVAVPHCMTRASAISRETVVKAEYNGVWTEIQTQEITYDHNKDMKFAQAGVDRLTRLAVVSRLKRDYHVIAGKSVKIVSAVDQRISLTCEKNTFNLPENLMLQIQPVDSNSLSDMKKRRPECSGLLNTSSIVKIQWEGKSDIKKPILVTIPVPPNPVKARKAAEMKKLKEARMKKPIVPTGIVEPEHARKKAAAAASRSNAAARKVQLQQQAAADEEDTEPVKPPTRWYMGQYATNDDDENDNLYLVTHDEKGYCQVVPRVKVTEIKMDVVQFMLAETLSQFTVVRTKTTVDDSEARQFASYIEDYLSQKVTKFVVKQRGDEPNSVAVECATLPKLDKTQERLEEEGFDDGPDVGPDIQLHEGDVVEVMFKGNVKNEDDSPLLFAFNSQLRSGVGFWATEASQYLQRQYPVFRGMIQMYKRTEEVKVVTPEPETVAMKAAAKKRMSLVEKKVQPADETEQQATTEDDQTADQVAPSDGEEQDDGPKYVTEVRHDLLCQLMVNIPKDHIEPVHPIVKAPVVLLSNIKDPVDDEYLHHLAEELGDEWKKLAHYLGLRRVRVQAIICNINKNTGQRRSDEEAKYEMLTTWMKRLPRGANKVSILRKCLSRTGRRDLVEELLDVEKDFIADKKNRLTRRPSTKPPMLTRDTRTTIAAV
ncbi:death domain-containing protein 1-like [Tubulanus polymorphus]|uniref:death domain-containing protein 1-like n=1 Tax=Tubulanus polymorphus TaxID=672921 RepID=UPI003DA64F94